jgi:hypothetical protein
LVYKSADGHGADHGDRLVRHLSAAEFVLMKAPPATAPTTSTIPIPVPD